MLRRVNFGVIFYCGMALLSTRPAKAQIVLDMSLITCKQLLEATPDRQALIGAWMGGYFSASKNLNMLDFRYVERNRKVVGRYCKSHKSETVMSAMQRTWH
jgi:acid stress chaperone HdeB